MISQVIVVLSSVFTYTRRRAWHYFFHLPQPITQMSRQWFDKCIYIYSKKQTNLYFDEKYLYSWSFIAAILTMHPTPKTNSQYIWIIPQFELIIGLGIRFVPNRWQAVAAPRLNEIIYIYIYAWINQHMEAATKWPWFCRTTFSNTFLVWKLLHFDPSFTDVCTQGSKLIDNKPVLVQIMALRWSGSRPFSEPVTAYFTDTYMCHSASMKWGRFQLRTADWKATQAKYIYPWKGTQDQSICAYICECMRARVCICICQRSNTAVYRQMYNT